MGLAARTIKYILKSHKKYQFQGPILTLGNQDIYASQKDLEKILQDEKIKFKRPVNIILSTSQDLVKLNRSAKNYLHAKTFFNYLGISEKDYYDIDKFAFDQPKIIHDLEKPLPQKYHNFFNFILDSGTLEHIFDIKAVMENIVKAVRINGYVLQMIPANNFLNHGFYQFSPTFFYDFYTSNGFEIIESYLTEAKGQGDRFHIYKQERDYTGLFFNPVNRLANSFLVKKVKNLKAIISPTQYYYKILGENSKKIDQDFSKTKFDKLVSYVRRIIPFKYHRFFFGYWCRLKSLISNHDYFDIT